MKRWMILPVVGALLVGLAGCPEGVVDSEEGQWQLSTVELVTGAHRGYVYGEPVLEGTPLCAAPAYQGTVPDGHEAGDVLDQCVDQSLEGPASWDEGCVLLEEAGDVTWYLDPTDCPLQASGLDLVADRIVFEVAQGDGLDAEVHQWVEEYSADALEIEPGLPEGWTNPAGEPFRVMAGERVTLFVRLTDPLTGVPVAWHTSDGEVTATASAGDFEFAEAPGGQGWMAVVLDEGAEVDLGLTVEGRQWTAAGVQAVGEDAPASIEIVAGYLGAEDPTGDRSPFGARAVVRDADGRLIYGTPVTWKVAEGDLAVTPGQADTMSDLPGNDYAYLEDACVRPSDNVGQRTVVLEASYGDLVDSLELVWTARTEAASDEGWEPSENCRSDGCSCSSTPRAAVGPAALAALLPLALIVRRR